MNKKKVLGILAIPLVLLTLFAGLKFGYINPMIKGIDIKIYGGTFITNLNKYVIKVGDKVGLSTGRYIVVPAFSKKPPLRFVILDNNGVLELKKNMLIAKKVGYSSIGILNKNRVIKKATIMVVNPTIKNMEFNLSNPIKEYGDKAHVKANVQIDDYEKLEKGYKLVYKSSNPKILKVKGNYVEAVGIGDVKLIGRYDRQEIQTQLKIMPRVDSIDVDKLYELEEGQEIQINPTINTSPHNANVSVKYSVMTGDDIKYGKEYFDSNNKLVFSNRGELEEEGIRIDKNGFIHAKRIGRYLVRLSAENKSEYIKVVVNPPSFKNINITNLQYSYSSKNNNVHLDMGWDYSKYVKYYRIYIKKDDEDYRLLDTVYRKKGLDINGNRVVYQTILENGIGSTYKIYVVGSKDRYGTDELTKQSNTITIDENSSDFAKKLVKNVNYKLDRENNNIYFSWDKIGGCKYRIYQKILNKNQERYYLLQNNVVGDHTLVKIYENNVDSDFYVVAISPNGQISSFSSPVKINMRFSD